MTGEWFTFADLEILPFSIPHDTVDPVAFLIRYNFWQMGFCTDLGYAPAHVKKHLSGSDFLYLEANHHPPLVHACPRPSSYKQRVLSRQGHLSNEQCGQLLQAVWSPKLKRVHLAHLSQECNRYELALDEAERALTEKKVELFIAHQAKLSEPTLFP